jgi:peptidoglycan/xylan/chitin deacetylase (PgdA/CDA1 family)
MDGIQILLTFDVDGETLWLSRDKVNPIGPVMRSQGAYGPKVAVPRILELLKEYDIKSTFFVPGWIADHYGQVCESILRGGHEVAHHGYLHEWPNRTPPEEEKDSFLRALRSLERITGRSPVGYRAPGWEFSDITLDLLLESGFLYSSNMMDGDAIYEHSRDGKPTGLIELPVSWVLDDAAYFMFGLTTSGYAIANARQVEEIWTDEFDGLLAENKNNVYVLTLHPQIIGRPSRLMMLERLIKHMRSKSGALFRTCQEAAGEYRGRHGR